MNKFSNALIYGGLTKEEYEMARPFIRQENIKTWRLASLLSVIYFLVLTLTTGSMTYIESNQYLYLCAASLCFFGSVLLRTVLKSESRLLKPVIYSLGALIIIFAGLLGIRNSIEDEAVTYMVLMVVIPFIIIDKPYRLALFDMAAGIIFYVVVGMFKTGRVLTLDRFNVIAFSSLGIVLSYYIISSRLRGFVMQAVVENERDTDGLTGYKNRTAYLRKEHEINGRILSGQNPRFAVIVSDVNFMKKINDTYGHEAGDTHLILCGKAMQKALGSCILYRIGGDEFAAILDGEFYEQRFEILKRLTAASAREFNIEAKPEARIFFACGMSEFDPTTDNDVSDVFKRADANMYITKERMHGEREL